MENRNKTTEEIIDLDDEALEKVTGGVNEYPEAENGEEKKAAGVSNDPLALPFIGMGDNIPSLNPKVSGNTEILNTGKTPSYTDPDPAAWALAQKANAAVAEEGNASQDGIITQNKSGDNSVALQIGANANQKMNL